jgi:hypothetical protein
MGAAALWPACAARRAWGPLTLPAPATPLGAHGNIYRSGDNPPTSKSYDPGKFGRLFGNLLAFSSDTPSMRAQLKKLDARDGPMDALDPLHAHPKDLVVNGRLSMIELLRFAKVVASLWPRRAPTARGRRAQPRFTAPRAG